MLDCGCICSALLPCQVFDYPTIGAIAGFIADTKYPAGLSAAAAAAPLTAAAAGLPQAALAAGEAAAAQAIALTGLTVRTAGANSLTELYRHMMSNTELHTVAPYNR
jgi:hypothetical protein